MIHAYDEYYLPMAEEKLGSMFEIAFCEEKISVDQFAKLFLQSKISKAIEEADPIYLAGKSANELLGIVLGKQIEESEQNMFASPEYWLGWILAYAQWYFNKPFSEIIKACPPSKLLLNYFPYHEMDESATIKLLETYLPKENALKEWRKKRQLTQEELSKISQVPLRTIKAYEQNKLDISKASAETIYKLARALYCKMEDLLK